MEKTAYAGWPNCIRLSNREIEIIVTTDVGPRVIRAGFRNSQNLFAELSGLGQTGGKTWQSYGGHRLWHAPEDPVRTYYPDNEPVPYEWKDNTLFLRPPAEKTTGIAKEMEISLSPDRNRAKLVHRLRNEGPWSVTLSVWCISVMNRSGFAIIPQEEHRPHGPDALLPVRPLVLWSYTDMADPRWTWGKKYIFLRQDPAARSAQKAGVLNRQGWAGYCLGGELFLKTFVCDPVREYPDFNTNNQLFTNAGILEVETLGPLVRLDPGRSVEHVEEWHFFRAEMKPDEESAEEVLSKIGVKKLTF